MIIEHKMQRQEYRNAVNRSETSVKKSYSMLAEAVIEKCARDIAYGGELGRKAERDVERGGLDLYFAILNADIPKDYFIKESRKIKIPLWRGRERNNEQR